MCSLQVKVKRSREKKQQEEIEKQHHVIVTENNLFKIFTKKLFKIMAESSPTSLTATVDGAADLPARNLPLCEEFHEMPLSMLPDYFWS